MKLTEKIIEKLTCPIGKKDRIVFDDIVTGLGVRLSPNGNKNFLLQFRAENGAKRRLPLGAHGSITLDQARQAARAKLGSVALGKDPAAERKAKRLAALAEAEAERMTLSVLLDDWLKIGLTDRSESYKKEAHRALSFAFKEQLNRRADELSKGDVVRVLDEIVKAGKSATASRTLAYGRAGFSWAVKRGRIAANPFAGLPIATTTASRDRVLSDDEVRAIYQAAEVLGFPFGQIIQVLLLTAQRREEVAGIQRDEISTDFTTWTIPACRAKNKKSHIVHLSPRTREIIKALPRHSDDCKLLFTTNGKTSASGFSRAKARLDAIIRDQNPGLKIEKWRLHDFRRTCVTWLAGAGFNPAVADKILNHTSTTGLTTVGNIYQRAEYLSERRAALETWAQHVISLTAGREADRQKNIISFRVN